MSTHIEYDPITDIANALDIDAAYWAAEAERDDINPDEMMLYQGRAEGLEWAAAAIRADAAAGAL